MKRTKYPIHPDFRRWAHMNPPLNRRLLPLMQGLLDLLFSREKPDRELTVERKSIPGPGGQVRALLYSPRDLPGKAPCLVYYHGGGFALPAAPYHYRLAREYALRCRCRVLFVDYRLAPEHPFPAAPEDCFAAYAWLLEQGSALAVDTSRVAVGGDSAGGALAAAVCLMARDRGLALPCGQLLVYPVTGVGTDTESMRQFTDTPMCNSRDIAKYDAFYRPAPRAGNWEYASPLDAASLEGLPPAYIETAEFDCLRDGGLLYARRLEDSGVPVRLHSTRGTMHGYDIVLDSPITRQSVEERTAFLKDVFRERKN